MADSTEEVILVKQLLGKEDMELGFGTTTQVRNGRNIEISRVNGDTFPYQYSEANGSNISSPVEIKTVADALDYIINRLPA